MASISGPAAAASAGGAVNAKYGIDPGFVVYTHVSGRYSPFHTRVIAATVSEAPYVLDGLMHHVHQTDLRIREHYTDTAGATDHVFGLCCLLGFQFAPRIKDLKLRSWGVPQTADNPISICSREPGTEFPNRCAFWAFARPAGETLLHQYVARHAVTSEMACGCTVGRCDPNETSARGQNSSDLVEGVPLPGVHSGPCCVGHSGRYQADRARISGPGNDVHLRSPARRADAPRKATTTRGVICLGA